MARYGLKYAAKGTQYPKGLPLTGSAERLRYTQAGVCGEYEEKQMSYDQRDINEAVNALAEQRPDPDDVMEILKARDMVNRVEPITGGHGVVCEDGINYPVVKTGAGYRCDCPLYEKNKTGRCVHTVAVEICKLIDDQRLS